MTSTRDEVPGEAAASPGGPATGPSRFSPEAFGKYYLVDPVAVGGMAEVFRAKTFGASGFEKVLVVKRILEKYAEDSNFIDMFIDEAKLSVQLTHPNIVQIFDFGKIEQNYFIAMEAVEGKDLKSVLRRLAKRGEHMPIELACVICHQAAKGLYYAHERSDSVGLPLNIVHRDVSPSNILVSYEGQIKVADFGIADADSGGHETQAGVLKGKYSYMSPEQSLGEALDQRSDVFSLGICLWESLTGHRLFRRTNNLETLEAVRTAEIPRPSSYNPQVPPQLDMVCLRALNRDKDSRFQAASELQHALGDFLLPETIDRLSPRLTAFMHERFGEEIRRERERLERGTRIAADLHAGNTTGAVLDFTFEEPTAGESSHGTKTVHPRGRKASSPRLGMILALVTVFCLLTAVVFLLAANILGGSTSGKGDTTIPKDVPITNQAPGTGQDQVKSPRGSKGATTQDAAAPKPATRAESAPSRPAKDEPPPTTGTLRVRSKPSGASVNIDGRRVGKTPLNWGKAEPGRSYSIEISKSGFESVRTSATGPKAGSGTLVSQSLKAVPAEPGLLDVNATPWAKVYIDGRYIGDTPIKSHSLPAGSHKIRLSNPRLEQDKNGRITIRAGKTTVKYYDLGP